MPKRYANSMASARYKTKCGETALQIGSEDLHTVLGGWIFARHSRLKYKLDPVIRRLQGFGILDKWRSDLYRDLSKRRENKLPCISNPPGALGLTDLRLAFVVLAGGHIFALIAFVLEQLGFDLMRLYRKFKQHSIDASSQNSVHINEASELDDMNHPKIHHRNTPTSMENALLDRRISKFLKNKHAVHTFILKNMIRSMNSNSDPNSSSPSGEQSGDSVSSNNSRSTSRASKFSSSSIETSSEEIAGDITQVAPYHSNLSRALRILRSASSRSINEYFNRHSSLPQRPDTPPTHLPPMQTSSNITFKNIFKWKPRKLNGDTLRGIIADATSITSHGGQNSDSDNLRNNYSESPPGTVLSKTVKVHEEAPQAACEVPGGDSKKVCTKQRCEPSDRNHGSSVDDVN